MKRFFLMLGVVSLLIMAVAAPVASAYTKGQAEADANSYAQLHYASTTTSHPPPPAQSTPKSSATASNETR